MSSYCRKYKKNSWSMKLKNDFIKRGHNLVSDWGMEN